MIDLDNYKNLALKQHKVHKKFLGRLKNKPPKKLDEEVQQIHNEVFSNMDCLTCANCCKTTGPLFVQKDIERIAKLFRLKPSQFIEKYLRLDEDNDYVLQQTPCAFLGEDNYCTIYEDRPKACREYPHTDRRKIYQINHLTIKNTLMCPAAYEVVERMMERVKV